MRRIEEDRGWVCGCGLVNYSSLDEDEPFCRQCGELKQVGWHERDRARHYVLRIYDAVRKKFKDEWGWIPPGRKLRLVLESLAHFQITEPELKNSKIQRPKSKHQKTTWS